LSSADSTPDAELVELIRRGSQASLEILYQRYLPAVWRYAHTRLRGNEHAAEDVVSETFLGAIRNLGKLNPDGGSLYGWLMCIARHKVADHWRAMRRIRENPALTDTEGGQALDTHDPRDLLEATENKRHVAETMAALADEERLVLEWKYLEDLSVREIADRTNRTEKAVEATLYRARRSFRLAFEKSRQSSSEMCLSSRRGMP
jgi:RNA polymerase sigma factor (sigma-70 family)